MRKYAVSVKRYTIPTTIRETRVKKEKKRSGTNIKKKNSVCI